MNLFERAAVFGDIHFGKKSDSETHNQDCHAYLDWFVQRAREERCDRIIFLGDYMEQPKVTNNLTLKYAQEGARLLDGCGIPVVWQIGNHDLYFKENRHTHSLHYLDLMQNIRVINEVTVADDCVLCPWLMHDEYTQVVQTPAKYVFGHFELPLFLVNEMREHPDRGGLHMDHFIYPEGVFSGHFHKRQLKLNKEGIPIWYVGNAFPMDYNDANDFERGMMVLPWGEEPRFFDWEAAPSYVRLKASELFELLEQKPLDEIFNQRSTIECHDDLNIAMEESLAIKEAIQGVVRRFTLVQADPDIDLTEGGDVDLASDRETVDSIVKRKLGEMDTGGGKYRAEMLIDLWEAA